MKVIKVRKQSIILFGILGALIIFFFNAKFIKGNYSIEQEEVVSFFDENNELFKVIKMDLDSLNYTNLEMYYSKGAIIFRSDNKDVEVNHSTLIENLKTYFRLSDDKDLRGAKIEYYKNTEWFRGKDRIEFSFYYITSKTSAVDTGIIYIEEDEEATYHQYMFQLDGNWFYYFTGLV